MFLGDTRSDAINKQWPIAQGLGIKYPGDMTPEEALQQKLITKDQYVKIKNALPGGPTTSDVINYHLVSPTLDVVGAPIVSTLETIRDTAKSFLVVGISILIIGLAAPHIIGAIAKRK